MMDRAKDELYERTAWESKSKLMLYGGRGRNKSEEKTEINNLHLAVRKV
jgi:hypothetical protein